MNRKRKEEKSRNILAPMSGQVVPLEQVPDAVFSQKLMGDGIAIQPVDGKIYAPVSGSIITVAETLHAYGIRTEDGLEILIHVGLDSVTLKGEGFRCHVKEGDTVTAGQQIAEVDLEVLRKNDIPTITPVILCNGVEGTTLRKADGKVKGGKDFLMTLQEVSAESTEKESRFSFDFLQKLGKVLMTVIAVMPAAGNSAPLRPPHRTPRLVG